jgi:hypothetical protein
MEENPDVATGLIAIYANRSAADRVADQLFEQGLPTESIHIDRTADEATALFAEMREESSNAFIAPQVGVAYPKEATKSVGVYLPIAVALGALVTLPFAFMEWGDLSFWVRAFWMVVAGGAFGGTIAAVAVPALASKSPYEPSAAQRGVVVRVDTWNEQLEKCMADGNPIRLDRLGTHERPIGTVTTEASPGPVEAVTGTVADEVEAAPEHREV